MVSTDPGVDPNTIGGGGGSSGMSSAGLILGIGGTLTSAIGAYYSTLAERYQLRSQALSLQFEASMAGLSARAAEMDAQALLEAGKHEKGLSTLRYGQAKAASRARQAGAGVQAGVGSAAEVQASIEAAKELDSLTIERNSLRAAGSARMRAVDLRNRALLARTGASNLYRFSKVPKPWVSVATSLVGGAGQVSQSYLWQQGLLQNQGGA